METGEGELVWRMSRSRGIPPPQSLCQPGEWKPQVSMSADPEGAVSLMKVQILEEQQSYENLLLFF